MSVVFNGLRGYKMKYDSKHPEKHLRVFENRSEYVTGNGEVAIFPEGVISNDARNRIKMIKDEFKNGYLEKLIIELQHSKTTIELDKVSCTAQENLRQLVELVTSEVGRALIGLSAVSYTHLDVYKRQR